jgi:hypothetical protein
MDETSYDNFRRLSGVKVWSNQQLDDSEIQAYIDRWKDKGDTPLDTLYLYVDGDYVEIRARFEHVPFERMRRITGYLVGSLDRFNDAKLAEVNERVKHSV